ncbi:MAG: hypothetical protein AAFR93_06845 [Pseudomonadota bacterium]
MKAVLAILLCVLGVLAIIAALEYRFRKHKPLSHSRPDPVTRTDELPEMALSQMQRDRAQPSSLPPEEGRRP